MKVRLLMILAWAVLGLPMPVLSQGTTWETTLRLGPSLMSPFLSPVTDLDYKSYADYYYPALGLELSARIKKDHQIFARISVQTMFQKIRKSDTDTLYYIQEIQADYPVSTLGLGYHRLFHGYRLSLGIGAGGGIRYYMFKLAASDKFMASYDAAGVMTGDRSNATSIRQVYPNLFASTELTYLLTSRLSVKSTLTFDYHPQVPSIWVETFRGSESIRYTSRLRQVGLTGWLGLCLQLGKPERGVIRAALPGPPSDRAQDSVARLQARVFFAPWVSPVYHPGRLKQRNQILGTDLLYVLQPKARIGLRAQVGFDHTSIRHLDLPELRLDLMTIYRRYALLTMAEYTMWQSRSGQFGLQGGLGFVRRSWVALGYDYQSSLMNSLEYSQGPMGQQTRPLANLGAIGKYHLGLSWMATAQLSFDHSFKHYAVHVTQSRVDDQPLFIQEWTTRPYTIYAALGIGRSFR